MHFKTEAISKITAPQTVSQLQSFLGLTGYYRRFVPTYGELIYRLTHLLNNKIAYDWTNQCQQAFEELKKSLISNSVLAYPDYNKQFILDTDASGFACGAILSQMNDSGDERPIAYYSSVLKNAQRNYSSTKVEMLGLVKSIRPIKYYSETLCRRLYDIQKH